jgi:hypothetical protein
VEPEEIKSLAAYEISRRRLLQGAAAAVGTGALGLAMSDPVYGATTGYDQAIGVNSLTYQPPTGLAQKSEAKDAALAWISRNEDRLLALNDQIWKFAELSLREWESSLAVAEFLSRNGFSIDWGTAGTVTGTTCWAWHAPELPSRSPRVCGGKT